MKPLSILIITYNWPPRNAIGTHRPYSWAKYWSESGALVTVLTACKYSFDQPLDLTLPDLPGVLVVEIPYLGERTRKSPKFASITPNRRLIMVESLRRLKLAFCDWAGVELDIRDRWYQKAKQIAISTVDERNVDVVVSTFGPRSCHRIASFIKSQRSAVKWVADYRDLWSQGQTGTANRNKRSGRATLEANTVTQFADAITTVSNGLANSLRSLHGKRTEVITNGYDASPEALTETLARKTLEKRLGPIRIVYTGMIYAGHQDPRPLFHSINQLIYDNKLSAEDIRVDFYGGRQPSLDSMIEECVAKKYTTVHGHVSREHAIAAQHGADLLLLLESGRDGTSGVLTGKIFEYLVSGTPILSLGSRSNSEIAGVLNNCRVGFVAENDIGKIKNVIVELATHRKVGWFSPFLPEIATYSRERQACGMLRLLSEL